MTVARNASTNLSFCFSSMAAYLDLDRPWLSEKLLAWPLLPSVDLRPESALSLGRSNCPCCWCAAPTAGGRPTSMSAPTGRCRSRAGASRRW